MEAIEQSLMPEEVEALAAHLQPLVENGQGVRRSGLAYLWATK